MAFTSNAWFVQDAYNPDRPELTAEQRESRKALRELWGGRHLRQWRSTAAHLLNAAFSLVCPPWR